MSVGTQLAEIFVHGSTYGTLKELLAQHIDQAILGAIEAEREACAQIADRDADLWLKDQETMDGDRLAMALNSEHEARSIAVAIRARGKA